MCIHATIIIFIAIVMSFYRNEAFRKDVEPSRLNFLRKGGTYKNELFKKCVEADEKAWLRKLRDEDVNGGQEENNTGRRCCLGAGSTMLT